MTQDANLFGKICKGFKDFFCSVKDGYQQEDELIKKAKQEAEMRKQEQSFGEREQSYFHSIGYEKMRSDKKDDQKINPQLSSGYSQAEENRRLSNANFKKSL